MSSLPQALERKHCPEHDGAGEHADERIEQHGKQTRGVRQEGQGMSEDAPANEEHGHGANYAEGGHQFGRRGQKTCAQSAREFRGEA